MAESLFDFEELEPEDVKVVTAGDGRVFHLQGTVVIKPRNEDYKWENPVPVCDGEQKLGFANLVEDEGRIVATMFLKYDIPERLSLQNDEPFFARAVIHSEFDGPFQLRIINELSLGSEPPLDDRILPVRVLA